MGGCGPGLHLAHADIFTDVGSLGHVALGALAAVLGPPYDVAMLAAFSGYQISQTAAGATWTRTAGELIEFAFGMMLGKLGQGVIR